MCIDINDVITKIEGKLIGKKITKFMFNEVMKKMIIKKVRKQDWSIVNNSVHYPLHQCSDQNSLL